MVISTERQIKSVLDDVVCDVITTQGERMFSIDLPYNQAKVIYDKWMRTSKVYDENLIKIELIKNGQEVTCFVRYFNSNKGSNNIPPEQIKTIKWVSPKSIQSGLYFLEDHRKYKLFYILTPLSLAETLYYVEHYRKLSEYSNISITAQYYRDKKFPYYNTRIILKKKFNK